ncbi:glycoside hydrolase family 9 protein [Arcticibacter sp.]|uniref:glycoside hydrolase family 9 protein n=1 Tax=Arcticibacter sp. TaxID=1872630 RepID=UPI00388D757C
MRVAFSLCAALFSLFTFAQQNPIRLNQIGFYKSGPKIAVVVKTEESTFLLINSASRDTVFRGKLGVERQSDYSRTSTRTADFSSFQTAGNYVLYVEGLPESFPFKIGDNVHRPVAVSSLKGFYYQRVSGALEKQFAHKWARGPGHPDTAILIHASAASDARPADTKIASPGGWYDAGDYNKYIVNSGITMGTLLSAYEDFSAYFDTLETNIPESYNQVPDILDEAIVNLRWMMTMQDPFDGGVYHKCTNASFDGMVMPGVTTLPRYVVQKSTAASLNFAAVTSQASRVLRNFNKQLPGLSDSCLLAARNAWNWALKNPDVQYDQSIINERFEPQINTGTYGDHNFEDEWFWAATELLITTGEKRFSDRLSRKPGGDLQLPSWSNVESLGIYSLLRHKKDLSKSFKPYIDGLKNSLIKKANLYITKSKTNAFSTIMGLSKQDFNWGSNGNAANQGILLLYAYHLTGNAAYINAALSNLDYILGRNATGYCFVTGLGSRRVMHPHHRPSVADGVAEPVPGLLSGGPNYGMQDANDGCSYLETDPEVAFVDHDCSYASNEIAINWNAPLVYLSNAMEALQSSIK